MIDFDSLTTALGDLDEDKVKALLAELAAADGDGAAEALAACQAGMDIVGERYESGEYFVAELIFAGDLMSEVAALLRPYLADTQDSALGKVVLCTAQGDIHDIGKNIVHALLDSAGIEVIDLGVDVSPERIIETIRTSQAGVLAMSGLLTLAVSAMQETVSSLSSAGLREGVKVIIGGAAATAEYCDFVGADAWSTNAAEGVGICRQWLAG